MVGVTWWFGDVCRSAGRVVMYCTTVPMLVLLVPMPILRDVRDTFNSFGRGLAAVPVVLISVLAINYLSTRTATVQLITHLTVLLTCKYS